MTIKEIDEEIKELEKRCQNASRAQRDVFTNMIDNLKISRGILLKSEKKKRKM